MRFNLVHKTNARWCLLIIRLLFSFQSEGQIFLVGLYQFKLLIIMALVRITNNSARGKLYQTGLYQLNNSRRNFSDDPAPNPVRKWKTWKDVPDSLIKTYSERDPYNMVYQDKEWIVAKKKQLWWTQDMNVNADFPYGKSSLYKVYAAYILVTGAAFYTWYLSMEEDFTTYRSKVKEMRRNPPDWRTPADKAGLVFCES